MGKEAFGAKAQPLGGKAGKAKATVRQTAAEHKVRIFGSVSFLAAFPPERMQCIKMFAPKFEKNFGAFLLQKPAGAYAPILYYVKNDKP